MAYANFKVILGGKNPKTKQKATNQGEKKRDREGEGKTSS